MGRKEKLPTGMLKRGDVYHCDFVKKGRRVRKRLSRNKEAAIEMLNKLRADADKGDFGLVSNDYPWADLKAQFLKWAERNVSDSGQYKRDIATFEGFRPVRGVKDITASRIDDYREHRLGKVCARTVNREVGTIHNVLNKGVERFKVIAANPIAGIKPLSHLEKKKVRRSLTTEEVLSLFEHSPEYLKPVWRMFMSTGIRKSELVEMQWPWIDFDRKCVTIPAINSKSRKEREIPLADELVETLERLKAESVDRQPVKGNTPKMTAQQRKNFSRDHVFVSNVSTPLRNNLLTRFYAICKRAGIEGAEPWGSVDIHSLRGSYITLAVEGGANPKAVQEIAGHSDIRLTMGIYAKATDRGKRQAVDALSFATCSSPSHVLKMVPNDTDSPQSNEGTEQDLQAQSATA